MSSLHRERGEYITAKEHVMTKGEQRGVLPVVVTSEHATVLACVCVCVCVFHCGPLCSRCVWERPWSHCG